MSKQEIERHNRRRLWREVVQELGLASEMLEYTQAALEDLGEQGRSDMLQPIIKILGIVARGAAEQAERA